MCLVQSPICRRSSFGAKPWTRGPICSLSAAFYTRWPQGAHPFREMSGGVVDRILNRVPDSPNRLNPGIPAKLVEVIAKALEKDRSRRYQQASEVRADLTQVRHTLSLGLVKLNDPLLSVNPLSPKLSLTHQMSGRINT